MGVHRGDVAVVDLFLDRTVRVLLHQFGVLAQRGVYIVEPNHGKKGFLCLCLLTNERDRLIHNNGRVVAPQGGILVPLLKRDVPAVVPIQALDSMFTDFGIWVMSY